VAVAEQVSIHGQWSSRLAFILAATGSAVGLGNIWKFPYIAGENGGGAFVLVYLGCIILIGIPIMMAETMIGRHARLNPVNAMKKLALDSGARSSWKYLGLMGVVAGFLILSYYSVIAGWAMAYVVRTGAGVFEGATADGVASIFKGLISDPERLMGWHTLFMMITMLVVARGVKGGLEKAVRFLMPALFVLLFVLVGYAMNTDSFDKGLIFLFSPDFSKITAAGILTAMGHAFFTLSLGMGAIMVYGSYLPSGVSIAKTTFVIAAADTLVALLAGAAIFPIVFANGLEPGAGPGLIFQTLPIAFGQMPGGTLFGTLFFVLLVFAALSSSISLIEPAVAWVMERFSMTRGMASFWCGLLTWFIGLGTIASFNVGEEIKLFGLTFFDLLDYLTANIMLPLGGLLIALFAGWILLADKSREALEMREGVAFLVWRFLVRFVAPAAVFVVFLKAIKVL